MLCKNYSWWIEIAANLVTNFRYFCMFSMFESYIKGVICVVGLLLPAIHQSWRFRHQLGLSRHRSHLRLWLEPSERPASPGQSSPHWPEETGNPPTKLLTYSLTGSDGTISFYFKGQHLPIGHQRNSGGRHHREGKEEDGVGPSGHSEDGHNWSNCSGQQLEKHKVRCLNCTKLFNVILIQ